MTELANANFDWQILQGVGLGGVCLVLIYFGYRGFLIMSKNLADNNKVVAQNTQAFNDLSRVMEQASAREMAFQEKMLKISEDTNRKVTELHEKEFLGVRK